MGSAKEIKKEPNEIVFSNELKEIKEGSILSSFFG